MKARHDTYAPARGAAGGPDAQENPPHSSLFVEHVPGTVLSAPHPAWTQGASLVSSRELLALSYGGETEAQTHRWHCLRSAANTWPSQDLNARRPVQLRSHDRRVTRPPCSVASYGPALLKCFVCADSFILTTPKQNCHHPRFTDGKTEARRGEITWSKGHSRQGRELQAQAVRLQAVI